MPGEVMVEMPGEMPGEMRVAVEVRVAMVEVVVLRVMAGKASTSAVPRAMLVRVWHGSIVA